MFDRSQPFRPFRRSRPQGRSVPVVVPVIDPVVSRLEWGAAQHQATVEREFDRAMTSVAPPRRG